MRLWPESMRLYGPLGIADGAVFSLTHLQL